MDVKKFMENIAVIGAGTMGNGIAHVFAQNGYKVNLIDISTEALDKAFKTIEKNLDRNNIEVHKGSQSDQSFIEELISKYTEFDIIIDDGSHLSKDVKKSFELLLSLIHI